MSGARHDSLRTRIPCRDFCKPASSFEVCEGNVQHSLHHVTSILRHTNWCALSLEYVRLLMINALVRRVRNLESSDIRVTTLKYALQHMMENTRQVRTAANKATDTINYCTTQLKARYHFANAIHSELRFNLPCGHCAAISNLFPPRILYIV